IERRRYPVCRRRSAAHRDAVRIPLLASACLLGRRCRGAGPSTTSTSLLCALRTLYATRLAVVFVTADSMHTVATWVSITSTKPVVASVGAMPPVYPRSLGVMVRPKDF
nr:hypothetical protein [Gammaproteobacteria bacterium]